VFVEVAKTPACQDIKSTGFHNKKKGQCINLSCLVQFVQVKIPDFSLHEREERDFSSASALRNTVVSSFHFSLEDYHMKFNMGC